MTVSRQEDGTICLTDHCPVEEAEPLLQMLLSTPGAAVDWTRSDHLHTAVVQVVLAARPRLVGPCGDLWVREWVADRIESVTRRPQSGP